MFPKLRKSVTGFVGNSVRLLFGQLPAHHHHHGGVVGVVKLSLSHFIIRKAVEPSHSLRGKREEEKKKKKSCWQTVLFNIGSNLLCLPPQRHESK